MRPRLNPYYFERLARQGMSYSPREAFDYIYRNRHWAGKESVSGEEVSGPDRSAPGRYTGAFARARGKVFLNHTFQRQPAVADSVQFLLSLGFYLMCLSLFLWNLGVTPTVSFQHVFSMTDLVQTIAVRLGISIFVVAAFHTLNILVLSVLNRNNQTPQDG